MEKHAIPLYPLPSTLFGCDKLWQQMSAVHFHAMEAPQFHLLTQTRIQRVLGVFATPTMNWSPQHYRTVEPELDSGQETSPRPMFCLAKSWQGY